MITYLISTTRRLLIVIRRDKVDKKWRSLDEPYVIAENNNILVITLFFFYWGYKNNDTIVN